jgi:chloramphenicol-sensitive protein RarD
LASVATPSSTPGAARLPGGLAVAIATYSLWGFLPLAFKPVSHVPSATVVADRMLWSLLFVGVIMIVAGRLREVRAAFADRQTVRSMLISSLLLGGNWLIYVWAIESGQVLETSFGYFINPLANILLGVVLLGERLSRWQIVSITIAAIAIGIQAIGLSGIPFIALGLASTFAAYGYFRKTAKVSSAAGLMVETLMMAPVAAGYLAYTFIRDGGIGQHADPQTLMFLALTGPATAVPLLLFAFAVQRLKLTTIGMVQYIAPSIAFLLAIFVFGEPLNGLRLVSFALIWLSLVIFTADSVIRHRAARG